MTTVTARLPQGRAVEADGFADITDAAVAEIRWTEDGQIAVTFDADLTPAQVRSVHLRITSSSPAEEAGRVAAAAYLDLRMPTVAHNTQQIRRLTLLLLDLTDLPEGA